MATLLKNRAHKPLASNVSPQFSYGSRIDVNEGLKSMAIYVETPGSLQRYALYLTEDEMIRLIGTFNACRRNNDG